MNSLVLFYLLNKLMSLFCNTVVLYALLALKADITTLAQFHCVCLHCLHYNAFCVFLFHDISSLQQAGQYYLFIYLETCLSAGCSCVMVLGGGWLFFLFCTLLIEYHLNVTVSLSVVADHVHPFTTSSQHGGCTWRISTSVCWHRPVWCHITLLAVGKTNETHLTFLFYT